MRCKLVLAALAVAALSSVSMSVEAATIYDNIYGTSGFGSDGTEAVASAGPLYDSFSTSSGGFNLAHVDLLLAVFASGGAGSVSVGLYSDSSSTPGALLQDLGTINDAQLTNSLTVEGFDFSPVTLDPNQRYWIGLNASIDSEIEWSYSNDLSGAGVSGEYWADVLGTVQNSSDLGPFQMRLSDSVSTVPLPGTLPLFAGGLGVLGFLRWGRRMRVRATG